MSDELVEKVEKLEVDDLDAAFGEKKKKKKKKVALNLEEEEEEGGGGGAAAAAAAAAAGADESLAFDESAPTPDQDDLSAFDLSKKKKKKTKKKLEEGGDEEDGGDATHAAGSSASAVHDDTPWDQSDREYRYDELLDRVYGILRECNPELTGEKRRTILKPPQVAREGTKKTVFTNFPELCSLMNRSQEHVMQFLLSELGANGSLDGQNRLVVKGRFLPKAFENVLRRYMIEYVLCNSCKSPDTMLEKEQATRLLYMKCKQCGSSRSVSTVKSGFQARVTSRKAERAAAGN